MLVCVLMLTSPSRQAPVVSRPSDYNVSVVFDNQCASKNDVEEIARAQNFDLARTVLRTHGKYHVVQSPQVVYLVLRLMCGTVSIKYILIACLLTCCVTVMSVN